MSADLYASLLEEISALPVLDAHEHLGPEKSRTSAPVDVFTLFSHYTQTDLESAGMTQEQYDRIQDSAVPLDERWDLFEPFWQHIRYGSYSRAALIAAREFYGCDDITRDTYQAISERMAAANTPGIYGRILREKCNIRACLTQIGAIPDENRDILIPLMPVWGLISTGSAQEALRFGEALGVPVRGLDDYCAAMAEQVRRWKEAGCVGLKMMSADLPEPPKADAAAAFRRLLSGHGGDQAPIGPYLVHEALRIAAREGLVVAVHCGIIWDNWNNVYTLHPKHMVPTMLAHRGVRFDLYHAAFPWQRDMAVIAKAFPNAYLNLCWCHVMSQEMTVNALDEWLDLVPANKISGFGGDYGKPVEKVFGHLTMAREDIARVLARRVGAGLMTRDQAVALAGRLLFDNPRDLYRLPLAG
jgi:uncharacterized protein